MSPTQSKSHDSNLTDTTALFTKTEPMVEENVSPRDMLKFAKAILFILAILFTLGGFCEMIRPDASVFEACKTVLPPIATLVIGYYFGKS